MGKSISGVFYVPEDLDNAVQELVERGISADEKIKSYNIKYDENQIDLNKGYLDKLEKIPKKNLKVELAYKLLDDAIQTKFKRNIIKRKTFQERIEQSLNKYHAKLEDYESIMKRLEEVARDVTLEQKREKELNLSDEEIAFYDVISNGQYYTGSDTNIQEIAVSLTKYLINKTAIDWINQEQIKAEIRMGIRNILRKTNLSFEEIDKLVPVIMEQAEISYK